MLSRVCLFSLPALHLGDSKSFKIITNKKTRSDEGIACWNSSAQTLRLGNALACSASSRFLAASSRAAIAALAQVDSKCHMTFGIWRNSSLFLQLHSMEARSVDG